MTQYVLPVKLKGSISDYHLAEKDILKIAGLLSSQYKGNVIYSGTQGSGKTTDLEVLAHALNAEAKSELPVALQDAARALQGRKIAKLDLDAVFASNSKTDVESALDSVIDSLRLSSGTILTIENTNQLIDGAREHFISGFFSQLSDVLQNSDNRVVMMVDNDDLGKNLRAVLNAHSNVPKQFSSYKKSEPTKDELASILEASRSAAEKKYGGAVELTAEADAEIMKLTDKYKGQDFYAAAQPDIAVSLRDQVMSYTVAHQFAVKRNQISELTDQIDTIEVQMAEMDETADQSDLAARLTELQSERDELEGTLNINDPELERLQKQLEHTAQNVGKVQGRVDSLIKESGELLRERKIDRLELDVKEDGPSEAIEAEIEAWRTRPITLDILKQERQISDKLEKNLDLLKMGLQEKAQLEDKVNSKMVDLVGALTIDAAAVQRAFEAFSGIPVTSADAARQEKLMNAEQILGAKVIGQDEAVEELAATLREVEIIEDPSRKAPKGAYLFIGPSGVGKTEVTRQFAEFNNEDPSKDGLYPINMSEMQSSSSISKLVGSDPGLVGYEKGGDLTNAVQDNPGIVVLFDEIEKGHDSVLNLFLNITDDENGMLRDNKGVETEFKDTFVIATSNIGSKHFLDKPYEEAVEAATKELRATLKPEILGRFTKIVFFKALSNDNICQIANLVYGGVKKKLAETGVDVDIDESALKQLVDDTYEPAFGARPTVKAIKRIRKDSVKLLLQARKQGMGKDQQVPVKVTYNTEKKALETVLDESRMSPSTPKLAGTANRRLAANRP